MQILANLSLNAAYECGAMLEGVRELLLENRLELTLSSTTKCVGDTTGILLAADFEAERRIVPHMCEMWPGIPVLCEEAEHSALAELVPDIQLLPYTDNVADLPDSYISVDGLDGSALYANGELELTAMSAGVIMNGQPHAGLVAPLGDGRARMHLYWNGSGSPSNTVYRDKDPLAEWQEPRQELMKSLIGVDDNKSVDTRFRELVINRLTSTRSFRYPLNVPSVAGGLKVLRGNLAAYVTSNARNWDIAGTAALCTAAGQIVRCLNGTSIPWNCVRMPPVVFARDEDAFAAVRALAKQFLET